MSNLTHAAGNAGLGIPLFAAGKERYFSCIGPEIRDKFASWGRIRVQKTLKLFKSDYSAAEYKEQERMLQDKILAGHYSWGSPLERAEDQDSSMGAGLVEIYRTTAGQVKLVQLLLEAKHGLVPVEEIEAIIEDSPDNFAVVLKMCMPDFCPNCLMPHVVMEKATAANLNYRELWWETYQSWQKEQAAMQAAMQTGGVTFEAETTSPMPTSLPS